MFIATLDPDAVDRECPLSHLADITARGDVASVRTVVDRLLTKCGIQATLAHITTSDFGDAGQRSALHIAANRGRAEILRTFLEAGVPPNSTDDAGCGPLHHACERGCARAAAVLLKGGADPEQSNNFGRTPKSYLEIGEYDLKETKAGKTVIERVFTEGVDSIPYQELPAEPPPIIASASSSAHDPGHGEGTGPYSEAAAAAAASTHLEALLRSREGKDWQRTRVSECSSPSQVSTACTVQVTRQPSVRKMSLSELVRRGWLEHVQQRLAEATAQGGQAAAAQEASNLEEDGEDCRIVPSPLHIAASYGHLGCLKVLLETRASVDHRNDAGDGLLHVAARSGRLEVVQYLLEVGADPNVKNCFGRTPAAVAKEETWDDVSLQNRKRASRRSITDAAHGVDTVRI